MEQTKTCHYCGEALPQDATVCPVCGESVAVSAPSTEEKTAELPPPIENEVVTTPETSSEPVEAAAPTPSAQPSQPAVQQSAPQANVQRVPRFDPNTGKPLAPRFDPYTGQPLQPRFDPNTGQPLFSQQPPVAPPPTNVSRPMAEYIGDEEKSSRKPIWLWLIIGIAIVLLAILLLTYCSNRGTSTAVAEADSTEVVDTNAVDTAAAAEAQRQAELEAAQAAEKAEYERTHSDEVILARAKQIWKSCSPGDSSPYLTSSLNSLLKEEIAVYKKYVTDGHPSWDDIDSGLGIWTCDFIYKWKDGVVTDKTGDVAYVKIKGRSNGEYGLEIRMTTVTWKMVYERGNWYVDDVKYDWDNQWAKKRVQESIKSARL